MQLTENFHLDELTFSSTALRLGIDNTPSLEIIQNLQDLCIHVLQPVRSFWGLTKISSGYRCPELNNYLNGAASSQHVIGQAADMEVPGVSNITVAKWIIDSTDFDQIILEYHNPRLINSGWIHVSYGPRQRRQILHKQKGQPYLPGLGV